MDLCIEPLDLEKRHEMLPPGLAASWRYVGTGNMRFQLTIRTGPSSPTASPSQRRRSRNSWNYFPKGFGPTTADLAGVTAAATGLDTVTSTSKTANPEFPLLLSEDYLAGDIVAAAQERGIAGRHAVRCGPLRLGLGHRVRRAVHVHA